MMKWQRSRRHREWGKVRTEKGKKGKGELYFTSFSLIIN
jgi:hypothetical protein